MSQTLPPNTIYPTSRAAWRRWLQKNHGRPEGIWLVLDKKSAGTPRMTYDDAVEEALCFGWIDGKVNTLDEMRRKIWISPRKPTSGWARTNKVRIERLRESGLMTPAGEAVIAAAMGNGTWTMFDGAEALEVPADLAAAFERYPNAAANFDAFSRSAKFGYLAWIAMAKRPETRAKRIEESARLAGENIRSRH